MKIVYLYSVFLLVLFAFSANADPIKADDVLEVQNRWLTIQELWDTAVNAESSVLTQTALNSIGNYLKSNTVWTGSEFTPATLSGKAAVLNYIRDVEAPAYTNSTRFSSSIKSSESKIQGVERITLSLLVKHYQTKVPTGTNFLPQVYYEIKRIYVGFVQVNKVWLVESLQLSIVKDERDDLVGEILTLRAENQRLAVIAAAKEAEDEKFRIHRNVIEQLYLNVRYPYAQQIIASGSLPVYFDPNVKGRIHPVGYFTEAEDVVEYFYGLSPPPSRGNVISQANLVKFSNEGKLASSEVIFTFSGLDGSNPVNLTQKGFWRFDDEDRVIEFDLEILNLGKWSKARGNDYENPAYRTGVINSICPTIQGICTGANQQYASTAACVSFLSNIPFGTPDIYWSNSVQCRTVHLILAAVRPNIHCSHVGPTGGGKCVDIAYADLYSRTLFPNDPDRLIGV